MTAAARPAVGGAVEGAAGPRLGPGSPAVRAAAPARVAGLLLALAGSVALRYGATTAGLADGIVIGLGFGGALAIVAAIDGWSLDGLVRRPSAVLAARIPSRRGALRAVALGVGGGAALIGVAVLARAIGGVGDVPSLAELGGGVSFPGWALATIVVAGGEEALLRGALFRRIGEIGGRWWAIAVTSLVFALMHVPFYGWHVVPLDIGVGIWLAGLRLESRGIAAPWLAHAIADLATWWL